MYILLRMVTFFTMEVLLKTNNMKISEVIKKLQEIQKEHGDLEVKAYDAIYFPVDEDTFLVHNNELLIRG